MRWPNSGDLMILTISLLSRATTSLGVAAGARTPNQVPMSKPLNLTPESELYLEHARRILTEIDDMEQLLGVSKETPKGLLRVNATLGFGRSHVAPILSRFVRKYPEVQVQLQLSVDPPPLSDDAYDVCIRFGTPPDARVIARHLAPNRRLLCASPAYLQKHGTPKTPQDLVRHNCIGIRQGEQAVDFLVLSFEQQAVAART